MEQTTKIALIAGGSRGLGKNSALKVAGKGIDLIVTYRSKKEEAEATVAEIEAMGRKAAALQLGTGMVKTFDAFSKGLVSVLKRKWGREQFDFLVNNAGINAPSPFGKTTEEDFDNLVKIHFKGVS